jgi:hypothetical protein
MNEGTLWGSEYNKPLRLKCWRTPLRNFTFTKWPGVTPQKNEIPNSRPNDRNSLITFRVITCPFGRRIWLQTTEYLLPNRTIQETATHTHTHTHTVDVLRWIRTAITMSIRPTGFTLRRYQVSQLPRYVYGNAFFSICVTNWPWYSFLVDIAFYEACDNLDTTAFNYK